MVLNNQYGYTAQPAVPSYMNNPGYVDPNANSYAYPSGAYPNGVQSGVQSVTHGSSGRLGDYVPQSANDGDTAPGQSAGSTAQYAEISPPERGLSSDPQIHNDSNSPSSQQGDLSYQAYQQAQIIRLTSEAQNAPLPAAQGSVQSVSSSQLQQPTQDEVYKPYVPYAPVDANAMQSTSQASYVAPVRMVSQLPAMPSVSAAQSGQQTAEQTDVLPSIHYLPNHTSTSDTSRHSNHADIAAYQAEGAREQQSVPGSHVANSMEGQSNPPPDTYETTQYTGGVDVTGNSSYQQVPQPGTPGSIDPNRQSRQNTSQDNIPQTTGDSNGQQYPQPNTGHRTRRTEAAPAPQPQAPPLNYPPAPYQLSPQPYPQVGQPYPLGTPPSDPELMQHNIPPLRGSYNPNLDYQNSQQLSERDQAELDLATLEASYSGWLGGTGIGRYRSGTPGLDRMTDFEVPFEFSFVLSKTVRFSIIPRVVFLNAGNPASANYSGSPEYNNYVPFLGTAPIDAIASNQEQPQSGVGGEAQLVTQNFGLSIGYTPYEFLVRNVLGHIRWKAFGGPFTLFADRDNVKDTIVSYAGQRDPGQSSLVNGGPIWGGVVSTGGGIRFDKGNERNGLYIMMKGADLSGYNVLENQEFDGTMGAYWRVKVYPGFGSLNVGTTFFGEHYEYNELGETYGLGGYFSPNIYFLGAVPITYNGYYGVNLHYTIAGSVGIQAFQQADQIWFPLNQGQQTGFASEICPNGTPASVLETHVCAETPLSSSVGLNYNIDAEMSYRIADHWYVGGFLSGNNTSNYNTITGGFFVRFLFKPQFPTADYPTGLFPHDGFRNLRVP